MGEKVGGFIAPGVVGTSAGGMLGQAAGSLMDRIVGHGDYTIKANSLLKASPIATFGKSCIRVQHREFIGDITSSTVFALDQFPLNPGLQDTFPWLSQIAANFEMYKFNGLLFEFISQSADALNSTNTALGKVIMATDYNVLDSKFDNEQQMYATEYSNSSKPSTSIIHAVECAAADNPLKLYYVRSGAPIAGSDLRFYDIGNFQIATAGSQAVSNIGELWVTYDVSLCKPTLQAVQEGEGLLACHARLLDYDAGGAAGPLLHNNNMLIYSGSNFTVNNSTTNTIEFDVKITTQRLWVQLTWEVNPTFTVPNMLPTVSNGDIEVWYDNGNIGAYQVPQSGLAGVSKYSLNMIIRADAPGPAILAVGLSGAYGTVYGFDLTAVQIPDNLGPL